MPGFVEILCVTCKKPFRASVWHVKHKNKRFCSRGCAKPWRRATVSGSDNPQWRGGLALRCKVCDGMFQGSDRRNKYCPRHRWTGLLKGRKNRDTGLELKVKNWLVGYQIPFQAQVQIADSVVDFLIGTTALECDGVYWHARRVEKDAARDQKLNDLGYTVLRL